MRLRKTILGLIWGCLLVSCITAFALADIVGSWSGKIPLKGDKPKVEFSGKMDPGGSSEEGTFYGDADNWDSQRS